MERRLLIPLVALTLVSMTALAAFYGANRISLSHDADDADHVTLYQNGLAAVRLVRDFQSQGGEQVLEFLLPTTTVFESIDVGGPGLAVREIRSSLAADPALHPGDGLVVHLDDGKRHEGTYLEEREGRLVLSREGDTLLVERAHVTAVEVVGRQVDPRGPGATVVTVGVDAAPGARTVRLSYLAYGAGWQPSHILDPQTGRMTFFAALTGLQDWDNVTLDLVSGNPRMVYERGIAGDFAMADKGFAAGASTATYTATYAPPVGPSEQMGDLRRYHYDGVVSLRRGESVRLPMATGTVEILRHYYEANAWPGHNPSWSGLPERYELRNTLGEVLPAGPVRVYLDGEWVGADSLPALGRGERGNITVSTSDEAKQRVVLVQEETGPVRNGELGRRVQDVTSTYELQVRNLRDTAIDLRATLDVPSHRTVLLDADPGPDGRDGDRLIWNDPVAAGQTLVYRVVLEQERDV